jgi:hypothetical protein
MAKKGEEMDDLDIHVPAGDNVDRFKLPTTYYSKNFEIPLF